MDHGDYSPASLAGATFDGGGSGDASLAFDGDPTTSWNSGTGPIRYIEVDFGSPQSLVAITALVDQTPSGETSHEVAFDGIPVFSWTGDTSDSDLLTHRFATVKTAQTVRITTTVSPSWVAWREIQFPSCQR
jgi:hypothetical protein